MVVFDASTLILLAKAELIERFLLASSIEAVVPKEVAREACEVKQSFDSLAIQQLISEKKIAVKMLKDRVLFEKFRSEMGLGAGEAEAIALAVALKTDLVATDDGRAIDACKLTRIAFTSAIGILVRMYEKGAINKEEAVLKLAVLERNGRYGRSIMAVIRSRLEVT